MVKESPAEVIDILIILLKKLGVKVTSLTIKKYIKSKPEKNSLLSMSQALTKWKVANSAYHIKIQDIYLIPCPFVAKISSKEYHFAVVDRISDAGITFCGRDQKTYTYGLSKFSKYFEGVVLAAESDDNSGELNYQKKRMAELIGNMRLPLFFLMVFTCLTTSLLLYSSYFTSANWRILILTATKSMGLCTCILLVAESMQYNNSLTRKLCHFDTVDCVRIIRSAGAKILGGAISWSELGLLYFSSSFLLLIFRPGSPQMLHFLSLVGMICLPYTFYSIYYQGVIIKKWCLLCCLVQLIFWLEALLLLPFISNGKTIYSIKDLASITLCVAFPIACWAFIKPFLSKNKQADDMAEAMTKYLYNNALFEKILQQQPRHSLPDDSYSIILAGSGAENKVTIVLNPFCAHCAETYEEICEIYDQMVNIELKVLFVTNDRPGLQEISVIKDILSINLTQSTQVITALRSWFNLQNYQRWSRLCEISSHEQIIDEMLTEQQAWCKRENIISTPTILVNGYELPDAYSIESLPGLLN
jgi:hypothetical protein